MNISGIDFESIVDGEGFRTTIFTSGCKHACKGCHNKLTHDFNYGQEFTVKVQNKIIDYVRDVRFIRGITLTGGDPMYSAKELLLFVKRFKKINPTKNIWIYSGFTYEEIIEDQAMNALLRECDILVDGKFDINTRDTTLQFRGSPNQRIIDIQRSLEEKEIIEWD